MADDTSEILLWKAYVVVALSIAARGCEICYLEYNALTLLTDPHGRRRYELSFQRKKNSGLIETKEAVIKGDLEVQVNGNSLI